MARPRDFNDILSKLPDARQSGDEWLASCPLPGHKTPAKHLTLKDAGDKALATCFNLHDFRDMKDYDALCQALCFDSLTYSRNGNGPEPKMQKTLIATFSYEYEKGKEAYQMRRFDLGNGSKTFEAWHKEGGKYISGMGEYKDKPILYHLPEVKEWLATGKRIYIPEGELKVDRIITRGGASTTSPFGAGRNKWRSEYSKVLAGAEVIILPDNDKPGSDFAQNKATSLHGIAKSIKILELPGLPEKGDIIDWFNAGGTFEQLEQLANTCPDYEPGNNGVKLRCMADVKAEKVDWLSKPYIPKGKVTLIEGDPGIGKSTATLGIATGVTLGTGIPGQELTEPSNVVIASAEDGLGDTIRPRLDAMRADVSRIYAIDGALTLDENGFALVESYLERIHPALLIIDPLVAYLGATVDIHRANEVRHVMAQLARLAEKFDVAILAVRHLTKGGMSKAIYRGLGSIDFTAACRSVLLAGCDSENPQNRALVHIKSNLAPAGPAIGYELRNGSFYWTGESTLTAAQILAAENSTGISDLDEAVAFLKDELADGVVPAKDVYRDAEGVGISKRTLDRAKAQLGATSRKQGEKGKRGGGVWVWELPDDLDCQDIPSKGENQSYGDLDCQDCHTKEFGNPNHFEAKKEVTTERLGDLNLETALGMPVSEALKIWRSEGAPVIHLGPGENCLDLEKLLANKDVKPEHLLAVADWLRQRGGR